LDKKLFQQLFFDSTLPLTTTPLVRLYNLFHFCKRSCMLRVAASGGELIWREWKGLISNDSGAWPYVHSIILLRITPDSNRQTFIVLRVTTVDYCIRYQIRSAAELQSRDTI